jgi:hypothetical protein
LGKQGSYFWVKQQKTMVILFDQFNLSENVYELIFSTEQQVDVGRLLIEELKKHHGVLTKTEMSDFANRLHDGMSFTKIVDDGFGEKQVKSTMSYNKRQFYDRILTPMKAMGMIDYDLYKKHYKLSSSFTKVAQKLAALWTQEVK